MKPQIGHIVLKVRSLDVSVPFYCSAFGMRKQREGRVRGQPMAFLTFGEKDHDIGLLKLSTPAQRHDPAHADLAHIALCIGDRIEELGAFKKHLSALGIVPQRETEHLFSSSVYIQDPDGIEIEVYVDLEPTDARDVVPRSAT